MSGAANPESEGVVSKVKVKKQIKTIVQDLETVLGDLKDVAKELKEVVDEIDTLTSSLRLEEEMTDSSKTDTLNSSSSSTTTTTTASSIDKIKPRSDECLCRPPPLPLPPPPPPSLNPGVLTVLRKPHPPAPPPRLTPLRPDDHTLTRSRSHSPGRKPNGTLIRNGIFPGKPTALHNLDSCCPPRPIPVDNSKALVPVVPAPPVPMLMPRHDKSRCLQSSLASSGAPGAMVAATTVATPRERVRFSDTVQYHGYCPDCDLQYELDHTDLHLHDELLEEPLSPTHRCCSSSSPSPPPLALENGGLPTSHSFPPSGPHPHPHPHPAPCTPHSSTLKPTKTILRKSTTTTV